MPSKMVRLKKKKPRHTFLAERVRGLSFLVYFLQFSIHLRALTKASIHGVTSSLRCLAGYHAFCQGKMARSGCGIMARWRPSAEQMPATL